MGPSVLVQVRTDCSSTVPDHRTRGGRSRGRYNPRRRRDLETKQGRPRRVLDLALLLVLTMAGGVGGFLAARPPAVPATDLPGSSVNPDEALAVEELERALLALERIHPGGVGREAARGEHFLDLGELTHDPVAPLRFRRLLEALGNWLRCRAPSSPEAPDPLDDPRDPPILGRTLLLLDEVLFDFLQSEIRVTEVLFTPGNLQDSRPTYSAELQSMIRRWIEEELRSWPVLPDQVARVLARLGPRAWAPEMPDLLLTLSTRVREVRGERRERLVEILLEMVFEMVDTPAYPPEEYLGGLASLEETLASLEEASPAIRSRLHAAAARLAARTLRTGDPSASPRLEAQIESLLALLHATRELASHRATRGEVDRTVVVSCHLIGLCLAQELGHGARRVRGLPELCALLGIPLP